MIFFCALLQALLKYNQSWFSLRKEKYIFLNKEQKQKWINFFYTFFSFYNKITLLLFKSHYNVWLKEKSLKKNNEIDKETKKNSFFHSFFCNLNQSSVTICVSFCLSFPLSISVYVFHDLARFAYSFVDSFMHSLCIIKL